MGFLSKTRGPWALTICSVIKRIPVRYKLSSTNIPENLPYTLRTYPRSPNVGLFRSTTSRFQDTTLSKIGMNPNWSWTLNTLKYSVYRYTKYLPLRPKFWSVLLYDQRFSRYKVDETRKCTEWLQTKLEHLTAKTTLHKKKWILSRRSLNFGPFSLYKPFPRYNLVKNRKCTEWPQTELEHLTVKITLHTGYTKNTPPCRCPNYGLFRSKMSGFQGIALFIILHWLPCSKNKKQNQKKKKKIQKIESLKFYNSNMGILIYTLDLPRSMHEFGEKICCVLPDKMFELFSHIWSHVNEKEKKMSKIKNFKFRQSFYNIGRDPP